jgi:hypothetical protein
MVFTGCIDAGGLLRAGGREFRQTALPHGVASPPQGVHGDPCGGIRNGTATER